MARASVPGRMATARPQHERPGCCFLLMAFTLAWRPHTTAMTSKPAHARKPCRRDPHTAAAHYG